MNDRIVEDLAAYVHNALDAFHGRDLSIKAIVDGALAEAGVEPDTVLRRDFDGNSEAVWLVEKMIGEMLTKGTVNE